MKLHLTHDHNLKAPNFIELYLHCKKCLDEKPPDISAADYQRIEVGMGISNDLAIVQVWCKRHDCNVDLITPGISNEEAKA